VHGVGRHWIDAYRMTASFRVVRICCAKADQYASKGSRSYRLNFAACDSNEARKASDSVLIFQSSRPLGIGLFSEASFFTVALRRSRINALSGGADHYSRGLKETCEVAFKPFC